MSTVRVQSDREIALEVGLVRGSNEFKSTLTPGPKYQRVQIQRGINTVPADIAREWLRKNKFLDCVKEKRIRIVDKDSISQVETA
jgi:hypothetical protein